MVCTRITVLCIFVSYSVQLISSLLSTVITNFDPPIALLWKTPNITNIRTALYEIRHTFLYKFDIRMNFMVARCFRNIDISIIWTVSFYMVHSTHAQQVKMCRHNTDNSNNDTHIGTKYVILAKYWMWLPDDGFNWTETCWSSFYSFNDFNNLRILHFVYISWKIKCWTFKCPYITNIFPNYNQQDATFLDLFISTDAVHVSGGSSAHHQEHKTVHTAPDIVNQYCC